MTDTSSHYSHLIGQSVNDGSHGTIEVIDYYGPKLVKAITTDGTVVDVTPFAKDPS